MVISTMTKKACTFHHTSRTDPDQQHETVHSITFPTYHALYEDVYSQLDDDFAQFIAFPNHQVNAQRKTRSPVRPHDGRRRRPRKCVIFHLTHHHGRRWTDISTPINNLFVCIVFFLCAFVRWWPPEMSERVTSIGGPQIRYCAVHNSGENTCRILLKKRRCDVEHKERGCSEKNMIVSSQHYFPKIEVLKRKFLN